MTKQLSEKSIKLLDAFTKSVRHSVLAMTTNAQSGHPGGSLGCVDYLSLLYTQIIAKTGEPVIVSNGHISPAVYGVLAEMGYIPKKQVVEGFRKHGQPYEGHVTRHVPGVWYGTGPLGAGAGAASGFALAQKLGFGQSETPSALRAAPPKRGSRQRNSHVYCVVGDGEAQEGQVYEMMNVASKYKLDNLIVFMDYNEVQLTDGLHKIMPYNPAALFKAGGWHVIEVDGHDMKKMWAALEKARAVKNKPVFILGKTIMGRGVDFMEKEGKAKRATWHGKAATREQVIDELARLTLSKKEAQLLDRFRRTVSWKPKKAQFGKGGTKMPIKTGRKRLYKAGELTDCRTAYGKALLDIAKANKNVMAMTADLAGSVKTQYVKEAYPERHIDVGVAEQQMISCAGGMSFMGMVPFASTFGAFISSRAKDQARVNDINEANVKMVATHCGLSVGEDGPTHQAIDDSGSFLGLFNTMQIEPADPNHCDRIIRYIASHYGNVYVRMGRHKIPVLTKANGKEFFGTDYEYYYGRCDILRRGTDLTIACMGGTTAEALAACERLKEKGIRAEVVIVSSIKKFDAPLFTSIKKTKRVLTVEDHNTASGLAGQLARALREKGIAVDAYKSLGVDAYQLSGTWKDLYKAGGIDSRAIVRAAQRLMT